MTPRQIAALAVRVLALYALFDLIKTMSGALNYLMPVLRSAPSGVWQTQTQAAVAQIALLAGFVLFLWFFADGLAAIMVKSDAESTALGKVSGREMQGIAFACAGLFIALHALGQIALAGAWMVLDNSRVGNPYAAFQGRIQLIASTVIFVCGVALVFGARGFVKFVRSARNFGRDTTSIEESRAD